MKRAGNNNTKLLLYSCTKGLPLDFPWHLLGGREKNIFSSLLYLLTRLVKKSASISVACMQRSFFCDAVSLVSYCIKDGSLLAW